MPNKVFQHNPKIIGFNFLPLFATGKNDFGYALQSRKLAFKPNGDYLPAIS